MKGQKWLISCMKKYRKNIAISSGIAIFSDVSKWCNILLLRYIAIQNAQPCLQVCVSYSTVWCNKYGITFATYLILFRNCIKVIRKHKVLSEEWESHSSQTKDIFKIWNWIKYHNNMFWDSWNYHWTSKLKSHIKLHN